MMRKAQGLPLSTIVIAALALLVLVAIATFVTGGFSKLFGGMSRVAPSTIDSWRTSCKTACSELQTTIATEVFDNEMNVWDYICNSKFVKMTFSYNNRQIHCFESPINTKCTVTVTYANDVTKTMVIDTSACEHCHNIKCERYSITTPGRSSSSGGEESQSSKLGTEEENIKG